MRRGAKVKHGTHLAIVVLAVGCVGPPPTVPDRVVPEPVSEPQALGFVVRSITISADAMSIPDERMSQLEAHGVLQRLDNELMARLAAIGRFGESGQLRLEISVSRFRLRTAGTAAWVVLTGRDIMGADVTVAGPGRSDEFFTSTTSLRGEGLAPGFEVTRLDRLTETLARRIVEQLDELEGG